MDAGSALQAVIAGIAKEPVIIATSRNERIIADTAICALPAAIDRVNAVIAIIAIKELIISIAGNNRIVTDTAERLALRVFKVTERTRDQAVIAITAKKLEEVWGANVHQRVIAGVAI